MIFFKSAIATSTVCFGMALPAFAASPDCYGVLFTADQSPISQLMRPNWDSALRLLGVRIEEILIDTSSAAKWEKGAHTAFDRDIVPVFNKWIGLPGFAAIVDAKSKRVIGCVNSRFSANEMASEIRKMCDRADGSAFLSNASYDYTPIDKYKYIIKISAPSKTTKCPPAFNVDPG